MIKPVTLSEVEYVAFKLAQELLALGEPIPDFSTRYPNILESCLAVPFQSFSQKDLYPGSAGKASILFYLMVKNRPFHNGNKRIALMTLLFFLYKNNKWLTANNDDLFHLTVWVAQSPAPLKGETVQSIEKFLKTYLTDL
ncbi:MAG: type II toxin-antitoxin system death-on-curing family toxin [Candidatus Saccharicenans sp.]|nr:MAG: hypothetical protein C0168_01650 [Candidatus Aminicenantes bacterium]HEK86804.1 type II toxin-antitoxin system death-on-curing family toxin [Candidatus Aminicenantes bacterium]